MDKDTKDKQQGVTALMHAGPERSLLVEFKDIDICLIVFLLARLLMLTCLTR